MIECCPVCESSDRRDVLALPSLPVLINAQVTPEEAPNVTRGDIDLVVCEQCGHMYNRSFDDGLLDYDASYENTLHYSRRFQEFASGLARRLVDDHELVGAGVGELGSGPGHFLSMLCDAGASSGTGWDPSYDADRLGAPSHPAVTVSTDWFPADGSHQVRLALSQHVLEHLQNPVSALEAQRRAVEGMDGAVYTEVPNGQLMQEHCALWDLIYEHLSYFVPSSLDLACRRAGLRVTTMDAAFDDQFLWCEAVPADATGQRDTDREMVDRSVEAAVQFGQTAVRRISEARRELERLAELGPVVLWGAGSKGMTYLNLIAGVAPVAAVVDLNPRKTGAGLPGTSHVISGPDVVVDVRPRTVLVSNPVYRDEIAQNLMELGVQAEVELLWE